MGFALVELNNGHARLDEVAAQFVYIALAGLLAVTRRRWQSRLVLATMLAIIAVYAVGAMA